MSDQMAEFATGWGHKAERTWSKRNMEDFIGVSKGGHLKVPRLRPFDFIDAPNTYVPVLDAVSNRMGVDALRGTQSTFSRNADYDEVFFQMAGSTTYETEFGVVSANAAYVTVIPAGVSYRATGTAGSLRMIFRLRDPAEVAVGEDKHIGHTEYDVTWVDAPDWPVKPGEPARGTVLEAVRTWDDRPGEETLIERNYDRLIGASTEGPGIHNIRLFDLFTEITGRRGPGPTSIRNEHFNLECFNSTGAQFAFHRGQRADEAQFQFQGTADNVSEFGIDKMDAGDLYVVKRGIAHRVIGSPNYRRMTWYSEDRWTVQVDAAKPLRKTNFEIKETVIEAAPWRKELETVSA
jgi:hypothetical protein